MGNNNHGDKMEAMKICLTAVLSVAELFILTKIMGKRQISQMSLFDYINGITIGSIAAEMAFSPIGEAWKPALAIAIYGLLAVLFALIANKSIKFRRAFVGKAVILMYNGKLYRKNFAKAKIDLSEFSEQCRINGYFNPDELQTVIMESNGQLSFLPKADNRPVMPKDLDLKPEQDISPAVIISDGKILDNNLQSIGKNEIWLRDELKKGKYPPVDKIFFSLYDGNRLYVFERNDEDKSNSLFC